MHADLDLKGFCRCAGEGVCAVKAPHADKTPLPCSKAYWTLLSESRRELKDLQKKLYAYARYAALLIG